jgi:hypothetical protein
MTTGLKPCRDINPRAAVGVLDGKVERSTALETVGV